MLVWNDKGKMHFLNKNIRISITTVQEVLCEAKNFSEIFYEIAVKTLQ